MPAKWQKRKVRGTNFLLLEENLTFRTSLRDILPSMTKTLLSYVKSKVIVDLDSMDPQYGQLLGSFQDMTSNQALAYNEINRPERVDILEEAIRITKTKPREEQIDFALDLITVLLAKSVLPYLKGRVHAQLSPKYAYNLQGTLMHARQIVSLFQEHGISMDRVCLKIPATGPSMVACSILEKQGIRTLATCLFSSSQALAANQASCLYIAPYFNELRVHFEPHIWKEYENIKRDHPMSTYLQDIVETYAKVNAQTLIMPASIVTTDEVLALTQFKVDHLTIAGPLLKQLSELPNPIESEIETNSTYLKENNQQLHIEYLADNGAALDAAIRADPYVQRKLDDALSIFAEMEEKSINLIKKYLNM